MASTEPDQDVTPALGAALAESACAFCDRIAAGDFEISDRFAVAFEPLNPVTEGHLLVVPRQHVPDAGANPVAAGRTMDLAADIAGPSEDGEAYNLITSAGAAATQTIQHLHIHIVPRREGDGLALPWTGQQNADRTSSTVALLGHRVRVKLDEHIIQEGKLLGFDDGGEIQIEGDDGFVWHGWPALEVTPVAGDPS